MGVYLYPNNTETLLKNAYIGEYGRHPGANTIAYYELNGDVTDSVGSYDGTWNGTASYETLSSGLKVANFPYDSSNVRYISSSCNIAPKTVSFWLKFDSITASPSTQDRRQIIGQTSTDGGIWQLRWHTSGARVINGTNKNTSMDTNWHHICLLLDNTTVTVYKDCVQDAQLTGTTTTASGSLYIGGNRYGQNGGYKRGLLGKISRVILEDKLWTTTEINNYCNQTKSDYGL